MLDDRIRRVTADPTDDQMPAGNGPEITADSDGENARRNIEWVTVDQTTLNIDILGRGPEVLTTGTSAAATQKPRRLRRDQIS
jgi:hypothetical protein